jgi:hypothetical protein
MSRCAEKFCLCVCYRTKNDTHDCDRREEEPWVEQGIKRNEGGREVERHCAWKRRTRANDNFWGQYIHAGCVGLHEGGQMHCHIERWDGDREAVAGVGS